MSDTERDPNKDADPPDNTGGGGSPTPEEGDDFADPPDNTGGGGKTEES